MASSPPQKFGLTTLTAMVVGGMVGAGVFSLPANFSEVTGVYGALISWTIAGTGMLMLAFTFQILANRRPDLDAGVYAYARAGFGPYLGFLSAFGYWASACVGNVSYWVLIKSTLGAVIPAFGEGNTLTALLVSSVGIWAFHFLISRGVKEAAAINTVVTVAKVVPLLVFLAVVAIAFKPAVFAANLLGAGGLEHGLFGQVRGTMLVTVFVFLGIEGASNYSRMAQKRSDVGRATVAGFLGVLALFASVTLLSYGVLPRQELANLRQPSVAGVLGAVVGSWGAVFIGSGLVVSVLGAYLAWTLMAAEVLSVAAKKNDMPAFLGRENGAGAPANALLLTSALIQLVLASTYFSKDAFSFALSLTSHLSLLPYLLSAMYLLQLVWSGKQSETAPKMSQWESIVAGLATGYTLFLVFAGGLKFLLLGFLIYAPGSLLFVKTRREAREPLFLGSEWLVLVVVVAGAIAAAYGLATRRIAI